MPIYTLHKSFRLLSGFEMFLPVQVFKHILPPCRILPLSRLDHAARACNSSSVWVAPFRLTIILC